MDVLRLLQGITPKQIALALVALILASLVNAIQTRSVEEVVEESVQRKAMEERTTLGPE